MLNRYNGCIHMNINSRKAIIKSLAYFKAVVDYGGYTTAARALDCEEPYVLKQVHLLEDIFQVKLLSKSLHGMLPTHEGEELYPYAERAEQLFSDLENKVFKNHNISGDIKISVTDGIGIYLIPQLLEFHNTYPKVNIEIISARNEIDLRGRKTDIAIVYQYPQTDKSMVVKEYIRELSLFASASFVEKYGMPADVNDLLENFDICSRAEYCENWPEWRTMMAKAKRKTADFDSSNMLIQATDNGLGVALQPLQYGLSRPNWVHIDIGFRIKTPYWVLSHYDAQKTEKIQVMLTFIDEILKHI